MWRGGRWTRPRPGAAGTAALAATLQIVAGLFRLADGVQAVVAGALRGLKDSAAPMVQMGFGDWVAGLPLGLVLAFPGGLGPLGLSIGPAVGLVLVAGLMLLGRMRRSAPRGMMGRHA